MKKQPFTVSRVEGFACEPDKKQSFYWDSKSPGLGVRVSAGGSRSYIFESRLFGKTIRTTIGDTRTWELGKARTEASRLKTAVDEGIDPREQRAEQQAAHEARHAAAKRHDATFGEAWDAYVESRKSFWSERHYQDHLQHASIGGQPRKRGKGTTEPGPLAALRPVKLGDLTGERIAQWLAQQSAVRPTMTALSFRLLRAFIRWASDSKGYAGLTPPEAYKARDVKDALPRVKAKEGDVLQREQLKAWFAAVRGIPNFVQSTYLQGLLITGARREELAGLKWEDVDLRWRSITLDDKVEGTGGRTIPLPPYLASLLVEQKKRDKDQSPWVFPSPRSEDGKIAEPRIAHVKALRAADLPHLSLHGLRRSFGTLSEWVEVPVGVVAQIQGHKPSAVAEKHYRRRPLDLLRKWHDQIEAWMLEQAGIAFEKSST
ncbi:tyrosine-type recombinase/integrase [Achromobacter aegrifaciens]